MSKSTVEIGDDFRDLICQFLTPQLGAPKKEYLERGKKADLYFENRRLGAVELIFLEAKNYTSPLSRQQVVNIWVDYSTVITNRAESAILLLVTRNGVTPQAQIFIDSEPKFRHQTYADIEREAIGLSDYVRNVEQSFRVDKLDQFYVNPSAEFSTYFEGWETERENSSFDLLPEIKKWLNSSDTTPMAILGGYGAGKSSLVRKLASELAAESLRDPQARQPIVIELGNYSRSNDLSALLGALFTDQFRARNYTFQTFITLSKLGRYVIFLDGFDEMKHAMTWTEFKNQVRDFLPLTKGNSKVILLGRPNAFLSDDERSYVLRGEKRTGTQLRKLPDWPTFIEYDLLPFDDAQRNEFINKYLSARSDDFEHPQEMLEGITRLANAKKDLFSKPVHAKILTDLAISENFDLGELSEEISRWSLYEAFFDDLCDRETSKRARQEIETPRRLEFLRDLAFWLWTDKGGVTSFHIEDIPSILTSKYFHGADVHGDQLLREYLVGSFLEKKSGDIHYFPHRSFAEFLVASQIYHSSPRDSDHARFSSAYRDGVVTFLHEAPTQISEDWRRTIGNYKGKVSVDYLKYAATRVGGWGALIDSVSASTGIRNLVKVLAPEARGEVVPFADLEKLILNSSDENEFFVNLSFVIDTKFSDDSDAEEVSAFSAAMLLSVYAFQRVKRPHSVSLENSQRLVRKFLGSFEGHKIKFYTRKFFDQLNSEIGSLKPVVVSGSNYIKEPSVIDERFPRNPVLKYVSEHQKKPVAEWFENRRIPIVVIDKLSRR